MTILFRNKIITLEEALAIQTDLEEKLVVLNQDLEFLKKAKANGDSDVAKLKHSTKRFSKLKNIVGGV